MIEFLVSHFALRTKLIGLGKKFKMPKRGTLLSELEQGKILGMRETGATVTDIATAIGRSYNCVNNFLVVPKRNSMKGKSDMLLI